MFIRGCCLLALVAVAVYLPGAFRELQEALVAGPRAQLARSLAVVAHPPQLQATCTPRPKTGPELMRAKLEGAELCE